MKSKYDDLDLNILYNELNKFFALSHDHEIFVKQNEVMSNFNNEMNKMYFNEKVKLHEEVMFDKYNNLCKIMDNIYELFERVTKFSQVKTLIAEKINKKYNLNGDFKDFFDGFNIKFEPYKKEYQKLTCGDNIYIGSEEINEIHYLFSEYILMNEINIAIDACKRISKVLYENKDNGNVSEDYYTYFDSEVLKVDKSNVDQLYQKVAKEQRILSKKLKEEQSKYTKNKGKNKFEIELKISRLEDKNDSLSAVLAICDMLDNRMYAQRTSAYSTITRARMKVNDLFYGGGFVSKRKPLKWTYVTKAELEQIRFLLENINEKENFFHDIFENYETRDNSSPFPEFE